MKRASSLPTAIGARLPASGSWYGAIALLTAIAGSASPLAAQICNGTPAISSIQYNYEQLAVGTSQGGIGTLAGKHFAAGLAGNYRSVTSSLTGYEGQLRLSGILGSSHFKVCPGVRLGYTHDTWNVRNGLSVSSNLIGLGAGLGVGYEQRIVEGLYLIPFASVGYGFNLTIFDVSAPGATTDVTADSTSGMTAEYGVMAHYRYVFAGWAASRAPGTEKRNPTSTRFIVGVTFSDRSKKK